MALPAPPPRTAPIPPPPPPAPLRIFDADELPYVAPRTSMVQRQERPGNGRSLEKAARVGLVLAIVVALAGVAGAMTKSGDDDGTRLASSGATPVADEQPASEDPLADDEPAAAEDPYFVPAGFQVVQGDGVYLSVPASWRSLSAASLERMFDDDTVEQIYPDLDPQLRAAMQAAIDQGAIFMAIDPDPAGEGRNINILSAPGEASLGALGDQAEDELEGLGLDVEIRDKREVDTPIGKALRLAYSAEVAGMAFDAVQYYVPADGRTYIVTGTGADDVTDQAVQTLRLGEAPTPT